MEEHTKHPAARILLPTVLAVVVLGAYLNGVIGFEEETFEPYLRQHLMIDDVQAIGDADHKHPIMTHPYGFMRLWTQDYWGGATADGNLYRPITVFSFWVNSFVTGLTPVPMYFRVVNIMMLWLLGVLLAWW